VITNEEPNNTLPCLPVESQDSSYAHAHIHTLSTPTLNPIFRNPTKDCCDIGPLIFNFKLAKEERRFADSTALGYYSIHVTEEVFTCTPPPGPCT
jgi:hypothetical protein